MLSYEEWHPKWEDTGGLRWWASLSDSLYLDSLLSVDSKLLEQVTVKAKKSKYKKILAFEQSVIAYYDIPRELDRLRDEGEFVEYFPQLLQKLNKSFYSTLEWEPGERLENGLRDNNPVEYIEIPDDAPRTIMEYDTKGVVPVLNGAIYPAILLELLIFKEVDAIQSIMLCNGAYADAGISADGVDALSDESLQKQLEMIRLPAFEETRLEDYLKEYKENENIRKPGSPRVQEVYCYINMIENWDPEKRYRSKGMRHTRIQGYSEPLEFYSPYYPDISKGQGADHRRTLYWNPYVETDANGEAVIRCNNANSSTFVTVSCETVHEGQPMAVTVHSIGL